MKNIKLPPLQVDFLRLCSCQVSSYSEYFIEIFQSLMSQVEGKTPFLTIVKVLYSLIKGLGYARWSYTRGSKCNTPTPNHPFPSQRKKNRNPNLQKCNFENLGQMKFKQCKATKDAQNTLVTINNSTPVFKPSVPSMMIKFRQKKYQSC